MAVRRKVPAVIGHGPQPQPEREPPFWRRLPLPGCGLTGAADPLFGSGLEHPRLFPGRPASGHPPTRAQAFLRARISAVLLSRAIYGMSSAYRIRSRGIRRCTPATSSRILRYSDAPSMQETSISTSRPSAALRMWASFKSHLPHQDVDFRYPASIICAARRTSRNSASPAAVRHCSATCSAPAWSTGAANSRKTTEPPPSRSAASSILGSHRLPAHLRHRSTNARYAGSNGHTLATTVPSGDRSATAQSPTPHGTHPLRLARRGPGDETVTPRAGREWEEGLHSVQAPQQHNGTPPGGAPDLPGRHPPSMRPAGIATPSSDPRDPGLVPGDLVKQSGVGQCEDAAGRLVHLLNRIGDSAPHNG